MNQDINRADPSVTRARRRLLRGAFSAAAVIPLTSGAQTALASNMRCVANQATPVSPATRLAGSRSSTAAGADGQVRVPLYKSTKTIGGTLYTRYWMKGADLFLIAGLKTSSVITGVTTTNYVLSSSNRPLTFSPPDAPGAISADPVNYNSSGWSPLTQDTSGGARYVSVKFDANGIQLGSSDYISSGSSANSALAQTCWSSFSGAGRPPTFT